MQTTTQALQDMAAKFAKEQSNVMEECRTLAVAAGLMRRHKMASLVEAVALEAKQRVMRAQWAQVTRGAAA